MSGFIDIKEGNWSGGGVASLRRGKRWGGGKGRNRKIGEAWIKNDE